MPLFIVLHNVHGVQRIVDMVKVVKAFKNIISTLIITKAIGAAAQSGVPEGFKIAFKENLKMIYLQDLNDIKELINPEMIYLVTPRFTEEASKIVDLIKDIKNGKRVAIVFCGLDSGFTKSELKLGKPLCIENLQDYIGPVAEAAIILYEIQKTIKTEN